MPQMVGAQRCDHDILDEYRLASWWDISSKSPGMGQYSAQDAALNLMLCVSTILVCTLLACSVSIKCLSTANRFSLAISMQNELLCKVRHLCYISNHQIPYIQH